MRRNEDPRRWPICGILALALLAGVFLVPSAWIQALFTPLYSFEADAERFRKNQPLVLLPWEQVLAKPDVEPLEPDEPEPERRPPVREDAAWWESVWKADLVQRTDVALYGVRPDSSEARRLALLRSATSLVRAVEPDSATASILARLYLEDGFRLGDLKTFLSARGYALDYADLQSREADMFDEHLRRTISVTDGPDAKLRDEEAERRR